MVPEVTIVMPAYNAEAYIGETIDSLLQQSFSNFELLVIDDGSTDATADRVKPFLKDGRVRYIAQANQGPSSARNVGIRMARGKYITCMDADDLSSAERLEKQLAFLNENPDVGVCGTWARTMGAQVRDMCPPIEDRAIRAQMLFDNCFIHSSVMMRAAILEQVDPVYRAMLAEDYDLWDRLSKLTRMHNIPEKLILYRMHAAQASEQKSEQVSEGAMAVRRRRMRELLGREISIYEEQSLRRLLSHHGGSEHVLSAIGLGVRLLRANKKSGACDERVLKAVVLAKLRGMLRAVELDAISVFRLLIGHFRHLIFEFGFSPSVRLLKTALKRAR